MNEHEVGIVGMACRFPGADTPEALWSMMLSKGSSVGTRRNIEGVGDVRGAFLEDLDQFDARAFKISPREAKFLDPQQRLLLHATAEAIDDAGVPMAKFRGSRTSVYVGIMWNDYAKLQARATDVIDGHTIPGSHLSFAANRISHAFDLRGVSVALDSGCASSLVALHMALRDLRHGDADYAIVAGVNVLASADSFLATAKANLTAESGECRSLDARADGFVPADGVGVLLLSRTDVALRDGQRVHAVVRGSAVNHNGRTPWIMATDEASQRDLLQRAYADADISPADVDAVEVHGTASLQGDAREAASLGAVVGRDAGRRAPLWISSVKPNIGHGQASGGVAQIIKLALCLRHGELPPALHFDAPNPEIPFDELGLRVPTRVEALPSYDDRPSIVAATALSFGGANAHVVLSSPTKPTPDRRPRPVVSNSVVFPISAHHKDDLGPLAQRVKDRFEALLAEDSGVDFYDVSGTAATRRDHLPHRWAIAAASLDDAVAQLERVTDVLDDPDELLQRFRALAAADSSDAGRLAERYMDGETIDWESVFTEPLIATTLPRPSLKPKRHWLDFSGRQTNDASWTRVEIAKSNTRVWESVLDRSALEIEGAVDEEGFIRIPGVAFVDVLCSLLDEDQGPRRIALQGLEVSSDVLVEPSDPVRIQLVAQPKTGDAFDFEVAAKPDRTGTSWTPCLRATLEFPQSPEVRHGV